jgi:hypothetical protein
VTRISALVISFLAIATGLASAANLLAPSGVLAHPNKFDRQTVTVLGIAQNVLVRQTGPGTVLTQFQLCDSRCLNVLEAGPPKAVTGQSTTVSGTFYISLLRGPIQAHDVIVVGP